MRLLPRLPPMSSIIKCLNFASNLWHLLQLLFNESVATSDFPCLRQLFADFGAATPHRRRPGFLVPATGAVKSTSTS
jgi:hypothetical protein